LLFTIGHSNHGFEHFLGLLRRHDIEAVADVRSRPYSRFVPHFSKDRLARLLGQEGLGYLFLGAELGGKPQGGETAASDMAYQGRVRQPAFGKGIDRLLEATRTQRIALMCRERDPLDCHRLHLICRYLAPGALTSATFFRMARSRRRPRPSGACSRAPAPKICRCSRISHRRRNDGRWSAPTMPGGNAAVEHLRGVAA
jgi:hypothetical protein